MAVCFSAVHLAHLSQFFPVKLLNIGRQPVAGAIISMKPDTDNDGEYSHDETDLDTRKDSVRNGKGKDDGKEGKEKRSTINRVNSEFFFCTTGFYHVADLNLTGACVG